MTNPHLHPYLNFDGDCRSAMEFYQDCLGGDLHLQTFGEAGMMQDPSAKDRILHAKLEGEGITFMASDTMPGMAFTKGTNFHMSLSGSDEATMKECFHSLSEGGTVTMELQKQFWGDTFGMLTDRFGVQWMVDIEHAKS
jgi:PhnB protein